MCLRRLTRPLGLAAALLLSPAATVAIDVPARGLEDDGPIQLVAGRFTSARLMAAIAKKIINENLNATAVVVEVSEGNDGTVNALRKLGTGEYHVGLEMWPEDYLACRQLDLCPGVAATYSQAATPVSLVGELGVLGKNGWYIPAYILDTHPELKTWEGYQDDAIGELFSTADTFPLGRFEGIDESYQLFNEEIIANLGLPFVVEYSRSEEAAFRIYEEQIANRGFFLSYMWEPSSAIKQYNLTVVELPSLTASCHKSAKFSDGNYNCGYPEEPIYKLVWSGVAETWPLVHAFVEEFTMTNEMDAELIYQVDTVGNSVDDVATAWVENSGYVWEPWVDAAVAKQAALQEAASANGSEGNDNVVSAGHGAPAMSWYRLLLLPSVVAVWMLS